MYLTELIHYNGRVLFAWPGRPGPVGPFFFDDQPGLAILASILFYWPEQPKVGPTIEFGR